MEELRATTKRRSGALRQEISARNLRRAVDHEHEATWSSTPSVIYTATDEGTHGNFLPTTYRRILAKPAWRARLQKAYTASCRVAHAGSRQRFELDCAASSDALLMNVFCHPATMRSARLRDLLSITATQPEFGLRVRVPLHAGYEDRTEVDMRLESSEGPLLVEAKLSETNFQFAREDLLLRYSGFSEAFRVDVLPRSRNLFRSYQLVRNVLAAQYLNARFAVFLDARRTDLLEDVFQIYRAVQPVDLRSRLHVVTWQEIAGCVSRTLQDFLAEKYGIEAAG